MPKFICENSACGRNLRVEDHCVMKRAQCPHCETINIVPSSFPNIFEATEKGTVEDVRYFIEQKGVDVNITNDTGNTPLHFAVDNTDISVLKYLVVAQGADVNAKNSDGNTPLYLAAWGNSNVEFLECLISQGADVNAKCFKGNTPLYIAAQKNTNVDILEYLISHGANVNEECLNGYTPLHIAAQCNTNVGILEYLIFHGAYVNGKCLNDYAPLHLAATRNANEEVTHHLISHGADVNARVNDGRTPLHLAVAYNPNVKVAEIISQSADVNARCNADVKVAEIVSRMTGTNVNTKCNGDTPLHIVAQFNTNVDFLRCLISQGADVNAREISGATPLHLAVSYNPHVEIAKYLIRHGADLNAKNLDGNKPIDVADTEEKKRILREAMPVVKPTASELLEQISPELKRFEAAVRSIEDAIFGDGPFTAKNMKNTLSSLVASIRYKQALGQAYSGFTLSEKKDDYQEAFNEFSETITKVKKLKELPAPILSDNRISSLIERSEKCEKEISKLRDVVRNFSD